MFQIGDYVVYRKDVCKISDVKENLSFGGTFYVLSPLADESLTTFVPVANEKGYLRSIISKEKAEAFITSIPEIKRIESNDKLLENDYKHCLKNNSLEDLMRIIKTTYFRNQERKEKGRKIGEKDEYYFLQAEKYLYQELALALQISLEEVKDYITGKVADISYES